MPELPSEQRLHDRQQELLNIRDRLAAWERFPLHRLEFLKHYGSDVEALLDALAEARTAELQVLAMCMDAERERDEAEALLFTREEHIKQLESKPMYGPEGRWKELRERADKAEEELRRLREALVHAPPPSGDDKDYEWWWKHTRLEQLAEVGQVEHGEP